MRPTLRGAACCPCISAPLGGHLKGHVVPCCAPTSCTTLLSSMSLMQVLEAAEMPVFCTLRTRKRCELTG